MNSLQKWCKDNLHVIEASANGEVVQIKPTGREQWVDIDYPCFRGDLAYEYRVKPRTIKIGDFDVPEPMRTDIGIGNKYFTPSLASASAIGCTWLGDGRDYELLRNGLCHETSEAAEVHAKALIALTSAK